MFAYRGHIVYVVTNTYPDIAEKSAVIRVAVRSDLDGASLGVLCDSGCVPLSPFEVQDIRDEQRCEER